MADAATLDVTWRSALMLAVCTPVALAAIFLVSREVERAATLWLAALLAAAVSCMAPQIIGFSNGYRVWPGLTFAPFDLELFLGPLFYLHADRLMRGGSMGWRRWLLLPGALQLTYYSAAFLFLGDYRNKWAYNDAVHLPFILPLQTIVSVGLFAWTLWAVRDLTVRYRDFLNATQSGPDAFEPIWLDRMVFIVAPAAALSAGLDIVTYFIRPVSYVSAFPILVAVMAGVAVLGFEALTRLHRPFPKMGDWQPGQVHDAAEQRREFLPERDWANEGAIVRQKVLANGWHLEPRLSIRELAARLATNETYLSKALNQGLGETFSGFMNGLKVEAAKEMIARQPDVPMLTIAHESGFNSKATFNRVFREVTGQTPTEFRQSSARGLTDIEPGNGTATTL
ncbi:MAG: helix-turn-helix domain-containing protein [Pseudomonadota bacterium]